METCLMLKTKDKRKFLTYEKNLSFIKEYAKTFNAEVCLVKLESKSKILGIKQLAPAICNPEHESSFRYSIVKKILPKTKPRNKMLKDAAKIHKYIQERILSGKPLSLKDLKDKYGNLEVTDACLCNHFTNVRKTLVKKGYKFKKLGAGKYCLEQQKTS